MDLHNNDPALVSIVIVNYKVPTYLYQTLCSVKHADLYERVEIIVVDNASNDNSEELITRDFPDVKWISLKSNVGFGRACNVGARNAQGEYLLLLNPDTVISKNTLSACVDFLRSRPGAGIVGPKTLNPDGTLQISCRRSFPTPMIALYRFLGLSRLFPGSRIFGQYNLTYMDPDEPAEVDAVSGSFMFMPRKLYKDIGGFDERFFMYGEDLDLCAQGRKKGFKVWYCPSTQIVHFKGKSSSIRSFGARWAFYQAMILFSRKYRHTHAAFFPQWLLFLGTALLAGINMGANLLKTFTACIIDLVIINATLWAGLVIRYKMTTMKNPYLTGDMVFIGIMHSLISICYLWVLAYRGVYTKERYSASNAFLSGLIASVLFMACAYLVKTMAYSRLVMALSAIIISVLLVAWRELLPRIGSQLKKTIFTSGKVLIIGDGVVASTLIENIEKDRTSQIHGIIWPDPSTQPGQFSGYPVVGSLDSISSILAREKIDLLLIATMVPWYSHIIQALSSAHVKSLTIRWVPNEILEKKPERLPETIPLHDFKV
ncbi:MAG: glycosyltransferase [Chitinivibrionales bacterium]|nr:glycosyltransferase [Chitinivibrionales bacterium]